MSEQKEKRPSKKVLIREIAELSDSFNLTSLERTNIENLIQIKMLLDSKQRVIMGGQIYLANKVKPSNLFQCSAQPRFIMDKTFIYNDELSFDENYEIWRKLNRDERRHWGMQQLGDKEAFVKFIQIWGDKRKGFDDVY